MEPTNRILSKKIKEKAVTHLYFHDKYLKRIPKINLPLNVLVLYLHNNDIYEINNLDSVTNLTSLYLHRNLIGKLRNLEALRKLKKLYLGHNSISVVENLENLTGLEELFIEKQFLRQGNTLCFDPRTIYHLSDTLQVLNISCNKIQSISSLAPLKVLRVFNASNNDIRAIADVCLVLKNWLHLKDLLLLGNPICKNRLYQELIIANVYCLSSLDSKEVSDQSRGFLKRLHQERIAQRLRSGVNLAEKNKNLPKSYPTAVQKAVSISILRQSKALNDENEIFDERNALFIPWQTLPNPQRVPKLRGGHKRAKPRQISTSELAI